MAPCLEEGLGELRDMTEREEKSSSKMRSAFASLTCLASPVNGDMLEQTPSPFGLPSPGAGLFRQGRELCLYLVGSGDLPRCGTGDPASSNPSPPCGLPVQSLVSLGMGWGWDCTKMVL